MKWIDLRMQLVEERRMQVRGKVNGRIYFVRKGVQLSRLPGNMDGNRWRSDAKFEGSRAASREFGAVTKLSQVVRGAQFSTFKQVAGHRELHAKLTGKFLASLKHFGGLRGTRDLPAERLLHSLTRMPWHKRGNTTLAPNAMTEVFHEPITLKPRVDFSYLPGDLRVPTWATHIRPFCTVIAVSDLVRRKNHKRYTPLHRKLHGHSRRMDGAVLDLNDFRSNPKMHSASPQSFLPHIIFPEAVSEAYSLLVLVGLEAIAYNEDGSEFDSVCFAMQTAWTGNIEKSTAESRLHAEYDAKVAEIYPIYRQRIAHLPSLETYVGQSEEEYRAMKALFEDGVSKARDIWLEMLKEFQIVPVGEKKV